MVVVVVVMVIIVIGWYNIVNRRKYIISHTHVIASSFCLFLSWFRKSKVLGILGVIQTLTLRNSSKHSSVNAHGHRCSGWYMILVRFGFTDVSVYLDSIHSVFGFISLILSASDLIFTDLNVGKLKKKMSLQNNASNLRVIFIK